MRVLNSSDIKEINEVSGGYGNGPFHWHIPGWKESGASTIWLPPKLPGYKG